jgi:hypothetical protein
MTFAPGAFLPIGNTVQITSVTTTTANVQLAVNNYTGRLSIRIFNSGASVVYVKFGIDNTVAAVAATDLPIAAGSVEVFTSTIMNVNYVAAITGSGTGGPIFFTMGDGI